MFVASTTFLAAMVVNVHSGWNYEERGNNVSHWSSLYAECGYARQSPIDIPTDSFSPSCQEPLTLAWSSQSAHYAIRNNGHSLVAIPFEIEHNGGTDIGGLEINSHASDTQTRLVNRFYETYRSKVHREYCFHSLHFHWGRDSDEGSEHTVGGRSYPLEMHLVHFSCDYYDIGEALSDYSSGRADVKWDDENVLAVVGVLFEIGAPNPVMDQILDDLIIDGISENKADEFLNYLELYYTEFDVNDLLPANREMVSYLGSLTTPPCYETVRWHVLRQPMTVSEEQMESFRQLLEGTDANFTQAPNFRPPQPLNERTIWSCQEEVDEASTYSKPLTTESGTQNTGSTGQSGGAGAGGSDEDDEDDSMWKGVAIAFIVLFCLTVLAMILFLSYMLMSQQTVSPPRPAHSHHPQAELGYIERAKSSENDVTNL